MSSRSLASLASNHRYLGQPKRPSIGGSSVDKLATVSSPVAVTTPLSTPVGTSTPTATLASPIVFSDINTSPSSIKVFVRVRPFNERERLVDAAQNKTPVVRVDASDPTQITVLDPKLDFRPKETHTFERCFWSVMPTAGVSSSSAPFASQSDVYEFVGRSVLSNAIGGFNGCIFAYGQTGSGKTYTMMGSDLPQGGGGGQGFVRTPSSLTPASSSLTSPSTSLNTSRRASNVSTPRQSPVSPVVIPQPSVVSATVDKDNISSVSGEDVRGIIPRITAELFTMLAAKHQEDSSHSFRVEVQFYEVYNERVYDLLEMGVNTQELRVRQDPVKGPFVDMLTSKTVEHSEDIARLIKKGSCERHTAATKMNERSSRSHAILALTIIQMSLDAQDCPQRITSKVNLVDLAGSERTGLTGVEGQRFTEATKINLSLTTLGRVIDCLADQSQGKGNFSHCPYRESNLTWLLMDSLGGNSKTTMIATISPSFLNIDEVVQTLRYASRARQIVNKVVVNEDPQARRLKELVGEIGRLNKIISEAGMCNYTKEYVQELEECEKSLRMELTEVKSTNATLRCELEVVQSKRAANSSTTAGSPTSRLRADSAFGSPSRRLSTTRGNAVNSAQKKLMLPESASSSLLESATQDDTPSRRSVRFERTGDDVAFLAAPSNEDMSVRVEELTKHIRDMVNERALLMGKLHETAADNISLIDANADAKVLQAELTKRIQIDEVVTADHVQLIERLSLTLSQRESELAQHRQNQFSVWQEHAKLVRDAIQTVEKEQREILIGAVAQARLDIRSLIFQNNNATEKMLGNRIRDELAKKHALAMQVQEEEWFQKLEELKEGFTKQLVQEREQHETVLKEQKQTFQKELHKARSMETAQDAESQQLINELRQKLATHQEKSQKQIQQLQAAHEKEKRLLKAAAESAQQTSSESKSIAVADAVAKGKAALDDLKKAKDMQIQSITAERDVLANRLAALEKMHGDAEASMEEQRAKIAKKELQLQEWQRTLLSAQALELKHARDEVDTARNARAASHERHDADLDAIKDQLKQSVKTVCDSFLSTASHQHESLATQLARLSTVENSLSKIHSRVSEQSVSQQHVMSLAEAAHREQLIQHQQRLQEVLQQKSLIEQEAQDAQKRYDDYMDELKKEHARNIQNIQQASENQFIVKRLEHHVTHVELRLSSSLDLLEEVKRHVFEEACRGAVEHLKYQRVRTCHENTERDLTAALRTTTTTNQSLECSLLAAKELQTLSAAEHHKRLLIAMEAMDAHTSLWKDCTALFSMTEKDKTLKIQSQFHSAMRKRDEEQQALQRTVETALRSSEAEHVRHFDQHAAMIENFATTLNCMVRQLRLQQEASLTSSTDALMQAMSQTKAETTQHVHEFMSLAQQQFRDAQFNILTGRLVEREQLERSHIEHHQDALSKAVWTQLVELDQSQIRTRVAEALERQYLACLTETFVDYLSVLNSFALGEAQQKITSLEQKSAAEHESFRLCKEEMQTRVELLSHHSADVEEALERTIKERDSLSSTTKELELKIGEANLEALEAELLRSQSRADPSVSADEASAGSTNIVGQIVRKWWSKPESNGTRATPQKGQQAAATTPPPQLSSARPLMTPLSLKSINASGHRGILTPRGQKSSDGLTPRSDAHLRSSVFYGALTRTANDVAVENDAAAAGGL